ncbi:unnamed protein product, partial [Urochloa humidicola]
LFLAAAAASSSLPQTLQHLALPPPIPSRRCRDPRPFAIPHHLRAARVSLSHPLLPSPVFSLDAPQWVGSVSVVPEGAADLGQQSCAPWIQATEAGSCSPIYFFCLLLSVCISYVSSSIKECFFIFY